MPDPKEDSIFIRVSKKEKAAFGRGAASDERPLSDWLRALARKRLRELGLLPAKKTPEKKEDHG
jgi:hypothetical protein